MKLKKTGGDSISENKSKLTNLLSHIKLKTDDAFGNLSEFFMVEVATIRSKYPKKLERLAKILRPDNDHKAKYISSLIMQKILDLINYWVASEVPGPVISLLRIVKYQILISPENVAAILVDKPLLFKTLLDLCANSNDSLSKCAANILFLILQRISATSKTHTELYVLTSILAKLKAGEGKVINALHLRLLQTLCAVLDCSSEDNIRKLPLAHELTHLSLVMKNSADFLLTNVRFVHSVVLYVDLRGM